MLAFSAASAFVFLADLTGDEASMFVATSALAKKLYSSGSHRE